jgi:hypothetical protein
MSKLLSEASAPLEMQHSTSRVRVSSKPLMHLWWPAPDTTTDALTTSQLQSKAQCSLAHLTHYCIAVAQTVLVCTAALKRSGIGLENRIRTAEVMSVQLRFGTWGVDSREASTAIVPQYEGLCATSRRYPRYCGSGMSQGFCDTVADGIDCRGIWSRGPWAIGTAYFLVKSCERQRRSCLRGGCCRQCSRPQQSAIRWRCRRDGRRHMGTGRPVAGVSPS